LMQLKIDKVPVSDAGMVHVGKLTTLQGLELSELAITDNALQYFVALNELRSLSLTKIRVTGAGIERLDPLAKVNLIEINLRGTLISPAGLQEVAKLPSLMFLRLARSTVDDDGIAVFKGHRKLRAIDVSDTRISDKGLTALAQIPTLVALDVSGTQVTDAGLAQLRFPDVDCVLGIADLQVSDAAVQVVQEKFPKCRIQRTGRFRDR
jgi:internalin A